MVFHIDYFSKDKHLYSKNNIKDLESKSKKYYTVFFLNTTLRFMVDDTYNITYL